MTDMRSLHLFLVHFVFELLGIFMVVINIAEIELINATENFLLNNFSIRFF